MGSGLSLARTAKSVGVELGHVVVGSISEVVGGSGIGFVHAKYKDHWAGEYAPEMAAGVGKVLLALVRGFGGSDSWLTDIVGGVIASPGTVLTSAKYGIKFAEYIEERAGKKDGPAHKMLQSGKLAGLPSVGYVPPVGSNAMTISEAERRRFAAGR